jgi:hypothetical protein
MPHSFRNICPGRWAIATRKIIPRFAGSAGVSPAEQLNSPVLAFGIGAFRIHNIAYRFRWGYRLWRHFAGGTSALPANRGLRGRHAYTPARLDG